ncbi:MAG: NAD(P)/FAD-dependent oxidoreductase [Deltaproteobacteria bacterium]|nr:NAD(P)/FAD-dependent oxidoreductase [Deltaproteobacteria bacterium]
MISPNNPQSIYDIIVIGAGASGMMAAGRAAESGARVLLLEKMDRAGLKLGITGKGRCNLTNLGDMQTFLESYKPDGRFLRNCFARFFNQDLMQFFEDRGVPLTVERGQRVFPKSNRALDVVSCLLRFMRDKGVSLIKDQAVKEILVQSGRVEGVRTGQDTFKARAVILAAGGASYPKTGSAGDSYLLARKTGHKIAPIRPFLIPLVIKEPWVKELQGLSLKNVSAAVYVNGRKGPSEFGEMLFTHFGVSGPIILTLSGQVVDDLNQGKVELSMNLKPALTQDQLDGRLQREFKAHHLKGIQGILKFLLPNKMVPVFLNLTGIPGDKKGNQITAEERLRLRTLLTDLRMTVKGTRPLEEAIVTAGGVQLSEVDPKTLESRIVSGLFLCGEVLDIQGMTGGYNLQAAFSTGWVAGESAARQVMGCGLQVTSSKNLFETPDTG